MNIKTFKHKAIKALKNPILIPYDLFMLFSKHIPDRAYIKWRYWFINRTWLNLKNPRTFNEKMQWLKLYAHKPEYSLLADKYEVKRIVMEKIGSEFVVPCLAVWETPSQIDIEELPPQFVIKNNFNSSGNLGICKNKESFDVDKMIADLTKQFEKGYFWTGRDKQYRDIKKRVFAEQFLDDGRKGELQDYKFWCFNGSPKIMYMTNKGEEIFENFYDMDFNPIMVDHSYPRRQPEYEKPAEFELMKELAAKLSEGLPFVRIDFYDVNGKVYFGEFTFFDWGGFKKFGGDWDRKLGDLIQLPIID